jgi:hypothetical protein
MGFLSSRPKIEGDELQKCLAYLEEEGKLVVFRGKEEDLYNNALVKYGKSVAIDSRAAKEMCRAAKRLAEAASEIIRRRGEMVSIPDVASAMYFAFQKSYLAYSQHVTAECAAWEAESNGMKPDYEYLRRLSLQSEDLRLKALKEERKLAERLKLSGDVIRSVYNNAQAAVATENWQPPEET